MGRHTSSSSNRPSVVIRPPSACAGAGDGCAYRAVGMELDPARHHEGTHRQGGIEPAGDADHHDVVERPAAEHLLGRLPGHGRSHPDDPAPTTDQVPAEPACENTGSPDVRAEAARPHDRLELGLASGPGRPPASSWSVTPPSWLTFDSVGVRRAAVRTPVGGGPCEVPNRSCGTSAPR